MELNVGQLLDSTDHEMQILVYHELFPGHHLQMTIAQETENLPSLRRIITFDAYIEGWAKYAETIPSVHGINDDPRFKVARLRRELISTINLALASKAFAFISRRGSVVPEDVRAICHDVMRHRIAVTYEAEAENVTSEQIIDEILNTVEVP